MESPPHPEETRMVTIPPNVRSIVDCDGAVILDVPNDTMTTLDATGAYVWQRLQSGLSIDAIVSELVRDTGADEAMVAKDVGTFMDQLESMHLVTTIDVGHSGRRLQHA
jgi:Coenzyme PQQ synthesis protein D (PqqD)